MAEINLLDVDIEKPRYDQNVFWGRAKHFFLVTNPLNILASQKTLDEARDIVLAHRARKPQPGNLTLDKLWCAKTLYDSAYHPDTGAQQPVFGRMSAQVPCNMLITGGMMCFYRSTPAVIFWQWLNQSFNALVNYTNRGGDAVISEKQMATSYVLATGGALATALGLNRLVAGRAGVVGRLVPFVAVCAANCINIPCMRSQELVEGTPVFDESNRRMGESQTAARTGISMVIASRVFMAMPGMLATPFVMAHLERKGVLHRRPWIALPAQIAMVGAVLLVATPLGCAFFQQRAAIAVDRLEPHLQASHSLTHCSTYQMSLIFYRHNRSNVQSFLLRRTCGRSLGTTLLPISTTIRVCSDWIVSTPD